MNLNKYAVFVKTLELGSVTAAAGSLGITQSAATQLIAALEKEYDCRLLRRNKAGVALTKEGSYLLPYVKAVVDANKKLDSAVSRLHQDSSTIKIAAFKSVAVNWLPEIIKEFGEKSPDIKIELIDIGYGDPSELSSDSDYQSSEGGDSDFSKTSTPDFDFAFVPLPTDPGYKTIPIYKDRLLAVLPADFHDEALTNDKKKACPVQLFASKPVICLSESIDRDARSVFENYGIKPSVKCRVEDDYALLAMVEKGLGISIVPELILRGTQNDVKILELDPPAYRTIGIAFPSFDTASPAAIEFADFVCNYVKDKTKKKP